MSDVLSGLSFAVAVAAFVVAILANRNARRSADAAERSAGATERQASAAEAVVPDPPPAVAWRAEARGKRTYALRNLGTGTANGVQVVVPDAYDGLVRPDLGDGSVHPGGSFTMLVLNIAELADHMEVSLTWAGQDMPVRVPLPPTL